MNALFGLPTAVLARYLVVASLLLVVGTGMLALRRRPLLEMGLRNVVRRPVRAVVIVVGLMLSTVVIATAFSTGDAMTVTVRSLITGSVGEVDEVVTSSQSDFTQLSTQNVESLATGGGLSVVKASYFPASAFDRLQSAVGGSRAIAGMMPVILEQAPAADGDAQLIHPNVGLLGLPPETATGFTALRDGNSVLRPPSALSRNEVYVNEAAAGLLSTAGGHVLHVYIPPQGARAGTQPVQHDFHVQAVVQNGPVAGAQPTVFLPLQTMQDLYGAPGSINQIFVVNRCGSTGAGCSRQAALDLRKVLVDRDAAEAIRAALNTSSGRSVLNGLQSRRTGAGKAQVQAVQRAAERGHVTDDLIYLLGDPQVAGTLRATASFLPTRDGRAGRTLRILNPLTVVEVKQSALNEANQYGSILTSSFLVLGLFSIASSLLLVFLVFVMLAAERHSEMGIARAIGLRRSHLVQSFTFEGMVYDLAASLLGVMTGVAVSTLIVTLVSRALQSYGIPVERQVETRSLLIAFCLGLIVTFLTVLFSAWRVSRLNIVEAIRGLSSEARLGEGLGDVAQSRFAAAALGLRSLSRGHGRRAAGQLGRAAFGVGVLLAMLTARGVLLLAAGIALLLAGQAHHQYVPFSLGVTLVVIGGALLLRWLLLVLDLAGGGVDRVTYTLAGAGLTAFWAFPPPFWRVRHTPLAVSGIETFALAGAMMVLGAVWIAAYNLTGPLSLLLRGFGRGGAVTAALKMAIAYPLQHRFRTGMAVAMFSLVIFTMVVSAVLLNSAHDAYVARERPPTGYDIRATAPATAGLTDITGLVAGAPSLNAAEFTGIGSDAAFSAELIDLANPAAGWRTTTVHLADDGLVKTTPLRLSARARGYGSDQSVWDALLQSPGTAVIAQGSLNVGGSSGAGLSLLGANGSSFQPTKLWLRDESGAPVKLTVIGVVDDRAALPSGVLTRRFNVDTVGARKAVPAVFFFKTRAEQDPAQAALGLELAFGLQGLETHVAGEGLHNVQTVRQLLNYLLEGFIGLGLISGMAALGVISTRAVVERRQQIGMLRAIGLRRRLVQLSFMLEISFISLLGIGVGVVLGVLLARNVVVFLSQDFRELRLAVPWREIATIAAIAYAASLATTLFAAWQAGRVEPAEALRYE